MCINSIKLLIKSQIPAMYDVVKKYRIVFESWKPIVVCQVETGLDTYARHGHLLFEHGLISCFKTSATNQLMTNFEDFWLFDEKWSQSLMGPSHLYYYQVKVVHQIQAQPKNGPLIEPIILDSLSVHIWKLHYCLSKFKKWNHWFHLQVWNRTKINLFWCYWFVIFEFNKTQ